MPFIADTRLQIGIITQQRAFSLLEEGDIDPRCLSRFYDGVRTFFEQAVEYSLNSLPLGDPLLQAATFVSFAHRATADPMHAEYFIDRYNY